MVAGDWWSQGVTGLWSWPSWPARHTPHPKIKMKRGLGWTYQTYDTFSHRPACIIMYQLNHEPIRHWIIHVMICIQVGMTTEKVKAMFLFGEAPKAPSRRWGKAEVEKTVVGKSEYPGILIWYFPETWTVSNCGTFANFRVFRTLAIGPSETFTAIVSRLRDHLVDMKISLDETLIFTKLFWFTKFTYIYY